MNDAERIMAILRFNGIKCELAKDKLIHNCKGEC